MKHGVLASVQFLRVLGIEEEFNDISEQNGQPYSFWHSSTTCDEREGGTLHIIWVIKLLASTWFTSGQPLYAIEMLQLIVLTRVILGTRKIDQVEIFPLGSF